ncbi:MAG: DNA mismatch repair endonuclease MutL [Lachnospiraceae bacterium]|nr:DNA mismatch repair endonuclease MutL [Lachnospiraceae bacterium]
MIKILNKETIDRISAGEVVERPFNVVKELVENSVDSGARAITVEIKGGGIDLIRVTDNGCGIDPSDMKTAFLRHATSKIDTAQDLDHIETLGFRGEALASICAVSETEMITCIEGSITGNRLFIRGGEEISFEEVGAPKGTTMIVRNLFYNTPARKKFLKTPSTETSYIVEMMEKIALSHPDISFQLITDNRSRFHTVGSGDLLDVIFRVYGRDTASMLVPINAENEDLKISGFLGRPETVRSNRNMEVYFINERYVKNDFISSAIEEGYREYLMLHKFPVVFLNFTIDPSSVDVNVHPAKLDVRITDQNSFFSFVSASIHDVMKNAEMIPENILTDDKDKKEAVKASKEEIASGKNPEPFEAVRKGDPIQSAVRSYSDFVSGNNASYSGNAFTKVSGTYAFDKGEDSAVSEDCFFEDDRKELKASKSSVAASKNDSDTGSSDPVADFSAGNDAYENDTDPATEFLKNARFEQKQLFDDHLLDEGKRAKYRIIGQVFDTYWVVQYEQKMFIIDQHAAHEKVNYERMMKRIYSSENHSQLLMPPVVVSLSATEESVFLDNKDAFERAGFKVENFGGSEYALRGVPVDLFGHSEKELFLAVLDEMSMNPGLGTFKTIDEKIAGMACKASVKGGDRIGFEQAEKLIDELLTLDNPYNCPHGRPTIISITKTEMEKKFKRIVD